MSTVVKELHLLSPFNRESWMRFAIDDMRQLSLEFPDASTDDDKTLGTLLEEEGFRTLCGYIRSQSGAAWHEVMVRDSGPLGITVTYATAPFGATFSISHKDTTGVWSCHYTWKDLEELPGLLFVPLSAGAERQPTFGL